MSTSMRCPRNCTIAPSGSHPRSRRSSPSSAVVTGASPWPMPTAAATARSTPRWPAPASSAWRATRVTTSSASTRCSEALAEEPGTYFLTDFLARTFEHTVWRSLGLDRYPELRDDYFHSYRRCIWLSQRPTPALRRAAEHAASLLGLPLERARGRRERAGARAGAHLHRPGCMKERADVVVIGAGIVGCSAAYYLTQAGVRNVVVIDQGPIGDTGGSSFHAPGLCFQTNGSKLSCTLAQWSSALYRELDTPERRTWWEVGSLEVATTPERLDEIRRRHAYATSWGLESHVIGPDEALRHNPLLDRELVHGALYVPSDGIAKGANICQALQERAEARGATFIGSTRATGIDMAGGRVRARRDRSGRHRHLDRARLARPVGARVHALARPSDHRDAADAAPLRLDRAAARAGRRDAGDRAADPAPPGSRHVLPPARRGLRHRRLRPRPDHDRAARARAAPGRPPDRDRPVLRGALARVAGLGARAAAAARRRRHRRDVQRALLVRGRQQLVRRAVHGGRRAVAGRRHLGHARRRHRQGRGRPHDDRPLRARPRADAPRPAAPLPAEPALRHGSRAHAVRRGLRHHPPRPGAGAPARSAHDALARALPRPRRRAHRERRLGARAVVPRQRRAAAARRHAGAHGLGAAALVADDRARASRHAHGRRRLRPDAVRQGGGRGARRRGVAQPRVRERDGPAGGPRSSTRPCSITTAAASATSRSRA